MVDFLRFYDGRLREGLLVAIPAQLLRDPAPRKTHGGARMAANARPFFSGACLGRVQRRDALQ